MITSGAFGLSLTLLELKTQLASKPVHFNQLMLYHQNNKQENREEIEGIISLFDKESEINHKSSNLEMLKGLYLLRVDFALDDAHEIIQYLPQDDPGVCYAHSLIHKLEGTNRGELGLTGFSNCGYWVGMMGTSNFPTYKDMAQYASTLREKAFASNQSICKFVDSNVGKECTWDPNKFLTLCMHSMERSEEDSEAVAFCEMIVMKEWELLVDHAMKQLYQT